MTYFTQVGTFALVFLQTLDGVIYPRLVSLWNWLRSPRPDVQNHPGGQAHPDQDTLDALNHLRGSLNALENDLQELLTILRTMQGELPTQQSQRQLQGQAFNRVVAALNAAASAL